MITKTISTFVLSILALSFSAQSFAGGDYNKNNHNSDKTAYGAGMQKDIVDIAIQTGMFNTLVTAVQAADLVDVLKSDGPFTVFAPNDEAFAKLPEGTVETLLKPENKDQLIAVLTYHVVPGKVRSSEVVNLESAKTVQGQSVMIKTMGDKVMIDKANVVLADVDAKNGIVHVIDSVILPK